MATAGLRDCPSPITFAVTNFDPDDDVGKPNFVDIPEVTTACGGGAECPAPNRIGTFGPLSVRTTTVRPSVVTVTDAAAPLASMSTVEGAPATAVLESA